MDTKLSTTEGLFERLKKKGINENTIEEKIVRAGPKKLVDLYDEVFQYTPYSFPDQTSKNPFQFVSSPVLSGGRFPCSSFRCRIGVVDQLARFAALYAEHVTVQFPIYDIRPNLRKSRYIDPIYFDAAIADFKILYYYRPLLEAGILHLTPETIHLCDECYKTEREAIEKLKKAVYKFSRDNLHKFQLKYLREEDNHPVIHIEGPEEFIGSHGLVFRLLNEDKNFIAERDSVWINDLFRRGVRGLLQPRYSNSYITNYLPDIDVLKHTRSREFPENENNLLESLSHDLPFIHNVPLTKLIELRKNEGESFIVYRDALRLALKSIKNTTENSASEVFNDIVFPELNKIDNTIKNSRKILTKNLAKDLIISAGAIGMGLFGGLISPTFGACLTALGGINFASGLVKQASHVISEPSDIRENGYYFLWKVRKESLKERRKKIGH